MSYKRNRLPTGYWKNPVNFIACGFGTGASPYAPGTIGTLIGVLIYLLIFSFNIYVYIALLVVFTLAGIWICGYAANNFGVHDHGGIVWDEVVGYLIGMIAIPFEWWWVITGFFIFRFFDIIKPYPIQMIDKKVHGGLGIMLDDVLAGIYTLICMHLLLWLVQ